MHDLKPGLPAPDFTLPLATFGTISLSNMRGKPVILYFYPKDDTPGCTTEACAFQNHLPDFGNFDTAVIGVSKDSVESHAAFAKKYGIRFHLASDANSRTCEDYGVWVQKNNYGTKYWGIERTTFLIDRLGIVRHIWHKVKVEGHAEEVLKFVHALQMGQTLPGHEPPPPPPAPVKAVSAKAVAAKPAPKVPVKAPAKPVAKAASAKKPVVKAKAKPAVKKPTAKAAAKKPAQKVAVKKKR